MARKSFLIDQQEAAFMLDVDSRTIQTWSKRAEEPLPIAERGKRGRSHRYDPCECVRWYVQNEISRMGLGGGEVLNLEAERAKLARLQARKTELDIQQREGELVPAELVGQALGDVMGVFKSRVLAIPSKLAPQLIGIELPAKAQAILEDHLCDALNELSSLSAEDFSG